MSCSGALIVVGPSLSLTLTLFFAQTEETEVDAYEATLLAAAIGMHLLAAATIHNSRVCVL